jgi:hypothetical protein
MESTLPLFWSVLPIVTHIFFAKNKIAWKKRYDVWLLSFELGPNSICTTRTGPEQYLCYHDRARTVSVLPGPDPNSICATRPEPEQYLCYQARARTVSVLPGPSPNSMCATRPGPEQYLCYHARAHADLYWRTNASAPDGSVRCAVDIKVQSLISELHKKEFKPLTRPAWQHNLLWVILFSRAN